MAFACQRNAYAREMVSRVVSCMRVGDQHYEVVMDDTPMFPEGGGQPGDRGKIGEAVVSNVFRHGTVAVHQVDTELSVGQQHTCHVHWPTRYDHMQQHSAQHLLSAIAEKKFKYKTLSWELGSSLSHVELNLDKIPDDVIKTLEEFVNTHIREHVPIEVHYITKEEAMQLEEVKSRGLPSDVAEPIRIIEIKGIEKNMCCGTHLSNLSEIQALKLLHTENMRGNTRLYFIAGQRVFNYLQSSLHVERKLSKLLSCGKDDFADSVERLKNNFKSIQKSNRSNLKELAKLNGLLYSSSEHTTKQGYVYQHREDADMDYIFTFVNNLSEEAKKLPLFVCAGTIKFGGQFVIKAPEDVLADLSQKVCALIEGKGGSKKGQFQGKAAHFKKLKDVEQLLREYAKIA